jgi:hypothetical protein
LFIQVFFPLLFLNTLSRLYSVGFGYFELSYLFD